MSIHRRVLNKVTIVLERERTQSSFPSLLHSVFKINIDNEFYKGKTVYSLCCNKRLTPELTFNLTVAI